MTGKLDHPAWMYSLTLDDALWQYRQGILTEAQWKEYAHLWQTGATRFEIRACGCATCRAAFPHLRSLSTGVPTSW